MRRTGNTGSYNSNGIPIILAVIVIYYSWWIVVVTTTYFIQYDPMMMSALVIVTAKETTTTTITTTTPFGCSSSHIVTGSNNNKSYDSIQSDIIHHGNNNNNHSNNNHNNNDIGRLLTKDWWLHQLRPAVSNAVLPKLVLTSNNNNKSKLQHPTNNNKNINHHKNDDKTSTSTIPSTTNSIVANNKKLILHPPITTTQQQQQQQQQSIRTRTKTTIPIDSSSLSSSLSSSTHNMDHPQRQRTNHKNRDNAMSIVVLHRSMVVLLVAFTKTTVRFLQTMSKDWYTGYYLRTTLERMDYQYTKRYDIPSCIRSIGRIFIHGTIVLLLGHVMEWMVGLTNIPCSYSSMSLSTTTAIIGTASAVGTGGGCHWWCALLWLIAVFGPGHAIGVAIAIWVKGLQLQFPIIETDGTTISQQKRPSIRHILSRPTRILRYILDPDQWFREILATRNKTYYNHSNIITSSSSPVSSTTTSHPIQRRHVLKPFDPDWRLFPTTWRIIRTLQMIAIAKEMYGTNTIMQTFMRLVLYQQILGDEWYRIVMCEKRFAWGVFIMIGYALSTLGIFYNMIRKPAHIVSSLSILMTMPSVLAVIVSFWMNILIYFERRQKNISIINI
jgi:hypothetical protein